MGVEIINDNLALAANGIALIVTGDPISLGDISKQPASPKKKESSSNDNLAVWGDENDFPQQIINVAEKSTEIPALLDWKARALQGKEVIAMQKYFHEDEKDPNNSKWKYKPINDEEINDFLGDSTFKRYMRESSLDLVWFSNVFPELIKSKSKDKIVYIGTQDASFCRWGKQNNKGVIEKCFVNANWPEAKMDDPETIKFDVLDPYDVDRVENLKKKSNLDKVIYPVSYPSPGKIYYQLSNWNGFITSGWAKISRAIPEGKQAMMNKMLTAKYIIRIPLSYWPATVKDWSKLSLDQQNEIKLKKLQSINDKLTGAINSGKSILNEFGKDLDGRDVPAWEIVEIENNSKGGEGLEDSREASEHLMRSLGLDPTLVGDGPGKKMGGGSGSDKRVAFNIYVALQQPYREVILEPLYFIAEYNGWKDKYKGLTFKIVEVELQTLDQGNTAKEVTN